MSEREPTEVEVHQVEAEAYGGTDIPVRVEGVVRAQSLPYQGWALRTYDLTTTSVKIANRDTRRGRIVIVASALCWIGNVETQAKPNVGFRVPSGIIVPFMHGEEVWAAADTGTASISVSEEFWTE
jgi:hypothetical protein